MILSTSGVVPQGDLVRHGEGVLDIQIGFSAGVLALRVLTAIDRLDGEVGATGIGGEHVEEDLELVELSGLL